MCGGGGDDGYAEEQRRREEERERQMKAATDKINELFGVTDGYQYGDPRLRQVAGQNALERKQLYNQTREDILNYFRNELDRQRQLAMDDLAVSLARRGVSGGSADLAGNAKLSEFYNKNLTDLTNRADLSVADLRAADEKARLNLINNIRSGMDQESAVAGATEALKTNIDRARESALSQQLGNMFDEFRKLYAADQYVTGVNQGKTAAKQRTPFYLKEPGSYAGNVSNLS